MAKPQVLRIYEVNPVVPRGWAFPSLMVVLKILTRLGVTVVQPIKRTGTPEGERLSIDLLLVEKHYHLLHKRKADKLLTHDEMEEMLILGG